VAQENQSKLFNEIVQFSPNSLQNGGGSGLGLWISKGIVERHHGSVGLNSDGVGQGSIFYLKLPVYTSARILQDISTATPSDQLLPTVMDTAPSLIRNFSVDVKSADELSLNRSPTPTPEAIREERRRKKLFLGLRVLIVDDAPMVRKLMTNLLTSKGTICESAEDGVFAVEMMRTSLSSSSSSAYDIIFMDFMMPNMNGPQATQAIRLLGYTGLIIGVTGNMMASDVELFLESGANVILPKPLSVPVLENYLMEVLH
jgi:CheY-like chemotaxis protein